MFLQPIISDLVRGPGNSTALGIPTSNCNSRQRSEHLLSAINICHEGSIHDTKTGKFCNSLGFIMKLLSFAFKLIRPSVRLSVTKYECLAFMILVTNPFCWYHALTFGLLQCQICSRAGDHNYLNFLVMSYEWNSEASSRFPVRDCPCVWKN